MLGLKNHPSVSTYAQTSEDLTEVFVETDGDSSFTTSCREVMEIAHSITRKVGITGVDNLMLTGSEENILVMKSPPEEGEAPRFTLAKAALDLTLSEALSSRGNPS